MYTLSVIIPTFNERANIRPMVALLDKALAGIAWEAVFVDDDSPDGTAAEVHALAEARDNIRLLHRIGRRGLSGACVEGILSAMAPITAVIDADLQHDETRLPAMLSLLQADPGLDLVIGSRHVDGGSATSGFSAVRAKGSEAATALTKRLLRIQASDPMSGFFMVRRTSFNQIVTHLQVSGFKILADMLAISAGRWKVAEVGYTFRARQHGLSKMDSAVAMEFLGLLIARMTGGILSIRLVLFLMVGFSGIFVQLIVLRLALVMGFGFATAQALGVFAAINTNFVLNNLFTYSDRSLKGLAFVKGLFTFYLVCAAGAVMNVALADFVQVTLGGWALPSIAGSVAGAAWNYIASSLFTWRAR